MEIVRALVAKGANVNEPSGLLLSPLHMACQGDHLELVKYLLEAGAIHDAPDEVGTKPIDLTKCAQISAILQERSRAGAKLPDYGAVAAAV